MGASLRLGRAASALLFGVVLALGGAVTPLPGRAQGMDMKMNMDTPADHAGQHAAHPRAAGPAAGGQGPSPAAAEKPDAPKNKTDDPPEVSDSDHDRSPASAPASHAGHAGMAMPPMTGSGPGPGGLPSMRMSMDLGEMDTSGMQGGGPPPDARDPDYSDSRRASHLAVHAHTPGNDAQWGVSFQRAEASLAAGRLGGAWDGEAWYGTDRVRAVLSSEGAAGPDGVEDARNELRLRIPYAPFWNVEAGARVDAADASPVRGWAVLGVSGIAPGWFRNDAFVYVGDAGRTALRLESTYDFRLNQKWVLFPRIEANAYGRADPALGRGSGLASGELGLRLRYEFVPWIAPYVGIETEWLYGGTARLAAEDGKPRIETRGVAGLRFWF